MGRLEQRITKLQKYKKPKAPKKQSRLYTKAQIAAWWASQWNWTRAAKIANLTELEAQKRWGQKTGWDNLIDTIEELNAKAEALCGQERKVEPEKSQQPPTYLQGSSYERDQRRWG